MRFAAAASALCLALALAAPADAVPADIETTKGVTTPDFPDQITEEYRFEVDDGTGTQVEMYGWVTRPDPDAYPELYADGQGTEGPGIPTILVLSPYNSLYQPIAGGPHGLTRGEQTYFPQRGYAYAQFDVVGTRESGGCYDYGGIRERKTGAAVIDALGEQDWSNGKVGMVGGSYDGTTQIAAAIEQPEHLAAIIPQVAIDRWYDYAYGGGVRYFLNSEDPSDEGFDTPFAFDFGFALIPPTSDHTSSVRVLEERVDPCDRALHTERAYDTDPVYDEFWDERDYRRLASRVKAPVFLEGGWQDHNVKHWDTTQFFEALPADLPKKMVIGQWAHSGNQFEDNVDLRHAWFDQWLLGIDTGIMDLPAVDSEPVNGERTQLASWPPPGTRDVQLALLGEAGPRRLALEGGGEASYRDIDKRLTEDEALDGMCEGRCLVFVSEPLTDTIRISGQPTLRLRATSDAESTHYTPAVFSEAPDGSRSVISRGFLNTRNRNGLDTSEALPSEQSYVAPVPIWDVDYVVPAGHRIGVTVQSANVAWSLSEDDSAATNTLTMGGSSWLELPLSQGAASLDNDLAGDPEGDTDGEPTGGDDGTGDDDDSRGENSGNGGSGDGVGDADDDRTLPATGAGAALPGLLLLGLSAGLVVRRRR